MNARGIWSDSAVLPNDERCTANCRRSEAHERARKMKSKNCIPFFDYEVSVTWYGWESIGLCLPSQLQEPSASSSSKWYRCTGAPRKTYSTESTKRTTSLHKSCVMLDESEMVRGGRKHLMVRNINELAWQVQGHHFILLISHKYTFYNILRNCSFPVRLESDLQAGWRKPLTHEDYMIGDQSMNVQAMKRDAPRRQPKAPFV